MDIKLRRGIISLSLILSILAIPGSAYAEISCTVESKASCVDSKEIIGMSSEYNAHAALQGQNPYNKVLCCSGEGFYRGTGATLLTSTLLSLSHTFNAHAENPSLTNYNNDVMVFIDKTENPQTISMSCGFYEDKATCDTSQIYCIVTLSGSTNAHLASCSSSNAYDSAICCSLDTDSKKPEISHDYTHSNDWVNGQQDITLTASDEGSGVAEIRYCWNNGGSNCDLDSTKDIIYEDSTTITIESTETVNDVLRFKAVDVAGNPSTIGSIIVKVDNTHPVTKCDNCPTGPMGKPFTVTLSTEEDDSGIDERQYCVYREPASDCSSFQEYSGGIAIGSDCTGVGEICTYGIKFYTKDKAGNQETPKKVTSLTVNRNLPWCEFTTYLPLYSNTRTIQLGWNAEDPADGVFDSYIISVYESIDGGKTHPNLIESEEISDEQTKSHTFNLEYDGHYMFTCEAGYLRSGDSQPTFSTLTGNKTQIDTSNPVVGLILLSKTNEETFLISWTVTDAGSGANHTEIYINGSLVSSVPASSTPYEYTGQAGKSYEVQLKAYDKAGNTASSEKKSITIDKTPPGCSVAALGEYVNKNIFTISWSSPDNDAEKYDVCINKTGPVCEQPSPNWGGLTATSGQFTGSQARKYYIMCRATDDSGNTGDWSPLVSTTVDYVPPHLGENDPSYPDKLVSSDYSDMVVEASVTDDVGLESVTLTIGNKTISPSKKSGTSGDTQWNLTWKIKYADFISFTGFKISYTDVNENSETKTFSYVVSQCMPGQTRECHPRDKATDKLYNLGVCKGSGEMLCEPDGYWGNCSGGTFPTAEDCDGLDNDCDGQDDEGLRNQEFGPPRIGTCSPGYRSCEDGSWLVSIQPTNPSAEICDGLDNDCDGTDDEGCECFTEGETKPCGESNVGACRLGTKTCQSGLWTSCYGSVLPSLEICDEIDNDCDGEVDEECNGVEPEPEPFPWWILSLIGFIILAALLALWYYFKRQGEELSWETLQKKWSSI